MPIEREPWSAAKPTVDGEAARGLRLDAVRSGVLASAALRRRGESIRVATVARYRGRLTRPELAEDISRRMVEALLAPLQTALEGVPGNRRQRELLDGACELFGLDEVEPR